ncbi:hypothetical protein T484DRAFT_1617841, partial [Baffinella frigidus]
VHHTPYTIHHTPYTIHHTPYTIQDTPQDSHTKQDAMRRSSPYTLNPKSALERANLKSKP